MPGIKFTKMQALGNDFAVIFEKGQRIPGDRNRFSHELADRKTGIGCDQVIFINSETGDEPLLVFFNSDGSRAGFCGNGLRCAGSLLLDRQAKDSLVVKTEAGRHRVWREKELIGACLGKPRFHSEDWSFSQERIVGQEIQVQGSTLIISLVSMGNPHCVLFRKDGIQLGLSDAAVLLGESPLFPGGINVELVETFSDSELFMSVWERGAGLTLACGSGAAAAVVASSMRGLTGRKVRVRMPGGELLVDWQESGEVLQTGPAVTVFRGEYFSD